MTIEHYLRLDEFCNRALDYMESLSLADIRVARVALRYSYRLGLLTAQFSSRAMLFFETGLSQGQLSKSLARLEKANVLKVHERKRGGTLALEVNTAYWQWDGIRIQGSFSDKTIFQTVVQGEHPKQLLAKARSREQLRELHPEFGFASDGLPSYGEALAAAARDEALAGAADLRRDFQTENSPTDHSRSFHTEISSPLSSINLSSTESISPSSIRDSLKGEFSKRKPEIPRRARDDNDGREATDWELASMCEKLWPTWEARRRDGWLRKLVADRGRVTVFLALQRAADKQHTDDPVKWPFAWLPGACDRIEKAREKVAHG